MVQSTTTSRRLRGAQIREFRDALLGAFSPAEFDDMLLFQLDIQRTDITLAPSQSQIVLEVIRKANRQLWWSDLLKASRLSVPRDPALFAFSQRVGKATTLPASMSDTPGLERTIRPINPMVDVVAWRQRLAELEGQVCRVEVRGVHPPRFGTGFLVGSDIIMTNYHVLEPVIKGHVPQNLVTLRFDYALMADGVTPMSGTAYELSETEWLVDHSEYSGLDFTESTDHDVPQLDQLDYALVRAALAVGNQPVGGASNKYPVDSSPRGWIPFPVESHHFNIGQEVFILQHPDGQPLKLSLEAQAVIGVNANGTRVRYTTDTESGSSGSPCFDANWNLIALHHGSDPSFEKFHDPEYNQGIPLTAILDLLEKRGKKALLGGMQ